MVFFIPQNSLHTFVQTQMSKTVSLEKELNTKIGNMPWIVFLKKENTYELPSDYKKVNLKSGNTDDPWELGAYTLAPPGSELAEYPDEILAAPPPFFPSLCVSPDKPRPFPVLFAPSTQPTVLPSLASYTVADLTPVLAPGVPLVVSPSALAAPAPFTSAEGAPSRVAVAAPAPDVTAVVSGVAPPHVESQSYPRAFNSLQPQGIVVIDPFYLLQSSKPKEVT